MSDRSSVMLPTLLAVLLGSAAILRGDPFLTSLRPNPSEPVRPPLGRNSEGVQTVPAPLWDDPLRAIYAPVKDGSQMQAVTIQSIATALNPSTPEGKTLLLGVLVKSGEQEEDRESRLRSRQAVHAAMGLHPAYQPREPDYLGYVTDAYESPRGTRLPFEVFDIDPLAKEAPKEGVPRRVIVLWLDEDVLGRDLAHGLSKVLSVWQGEFKASSCAVIGPTSSDGLDALITGKDVVKSAPEDGAESIPIYSPWATKKIKDLGEHYAVKGGHRFRLRRMIGDDEALAKALAAELELRNVKPTRRAFLIEWDTSYGRGLFEVFKRHAAASRKGTSANDATGPALFRYTRGLDGVAPGAAPGKGPALVPPAEGTSRLDAVARLRLSFQSAGTDLQAVGILGTDVYDKLLLLRALRRSCPNAVFFTTDLDARLLDPEERDITRNLVVASHYGLELAPKLQHGILPFRSGYQTAAFLSAAVALEKEGFEECAAKASDEPPHVYEIGRSGPFDLALPSACEACERPPCLHPDGPRALGKNWLGSLLQFSWTPFEVIFLGSILLFMAYYAWLAVYSDRRPRHGANRALAWAVVLSLLVVTAIAFFNGYFADDGEPFAVAEGVSVWPTCFLRVVFCGLCVFYLGAVLRLLKAVHDELDEDYFKNSKRGIPPASQPMGPPFEWKPTTWPGYAKWWRDAYDSLRWAPASDGRPSAVDLWGQAKGIGGEGAVLHRFWVLVPAYCLATVALFELTTWPSSPTRGDLAWWTNQVTRLPCLFLLIGLNAVVCDAACTQLALLRNFSEWDPWWPGAVRSRIAAEWEVPRRAANTWLSFQLVLRRGQVVEKFVYYPFVALLVLIVIHNPVFDDFSVPGALLFGYGLSFGFTVLSGYLLSRATGKAREKALERLRSAEIALRSQPGEADKHTMEMLKQLRAEVVSTEEGPVAGLLSSPTLRALLIPSGGVGVLSLIEYFTRAN